MKLFKINQNYTIVCEAKKTKNGFKHEATLITDKNEQIGKEQIHYLNRTWESYEFESVIKVLLNKTKIWREAELEEIYQRLSNEAQQESSKHFRFIGALAKIGETLQPTQREKNDWKERMLKLGLGEEGSIMPNDWATLSENEKEIRLNKVIKELQK